MTYDIVLSALSDPTRRHVYEALAANPQPVGALAKKLPVSRPAVSQHLKVLSDAGLIEATSKGTRNIYRATPTGLEDLRQYLDQVWGDVLDSFAAEIEGEYKA